MSTPAQAFAQVRSVLAAGQAERAAELNAQFTAQFPDDVMLHIQRSRIAIIRDRYREADRAAAMAWDVYRRVPQAPGSAVHVLNRLRMFGHDAAAREMLQDTSLMSALPAAELAVACFQAATLEMPALAAQLGELAMQRDPRNLQAAVARAQALIFAGELDDARTLLQRVLSGNPLDPLGWFLLAKLVRRDETDATLAGLRHAMPRFRPGTREMGYLQLAEHWIQDRADNVPAAWQALRAGLRTFRGMQHYQADADHALFAQLTAIPALTEPAAAADRHPGPRPIFVAGMHRSGTTLVEQLLSAHPGVSALGERMDLTHAMREVSDHFAPQGLDPLTIQRLLESREWQRLGGRYMHNIAADAGGASHVTDKLPQNALATEFIVRALPQARIVLLRRDPMETGFSNLRELFSEGTARYSYDLAELGRYLRLHSAYMDHLAARYPQQVLQVDYAELLAAPRDTMQAIARFVGLEWHEAMTSTAAATRTVTTASAAQVRREINPSNAGAQAKWRRYAEYLQPLRDALHGP